MKAQRRAGLALKIEERSWSASFRDGRVGHSAKRRESDKTCAVTYGNTSRTLASHPY